MREDDLIRLRHMLDAAREAISFSSNQSRSDLETNRMLVLSLVKDIEIVGEAAFQISPSTREELPEIPWEDIIVCAIALSMPILTLIWKSFGGQCKTTCPRW
jgi:uncharacterized protein with HEPN domain